MSPETVPAAPALVHAAPDFPECWLTAATQPALPPPYPITAYDLGENRVETNYTPPFYLTKRDEWRSKPRPLIRARRTKKESPLTRIAIELLKKLPEVRRDEKGNLVPAGVELWL